MSGARINKKKSEAMQVGGKNLKGVRFDNGGISATNLNEIEKKMTQSKIMWKSVHHYQQIDI